MMSVDFSSMVVTGCNDLDVAELLLSDESLPPYISVEVCFEIWSLRKMKA